MQRLHERRPVVTGSRVIAIITALITAAVSFGAMATSATAATEHFSTPVSGLFVNPCNGDLIFLSGTLDQNSNYTTNANTVHMSIHEALQGTGADVVDGDGYHFGLKTNEETNVAQGYEGTLVEHLRLISQGADPNFSASVSEHITVDANHTVTVDRLWFDPVSCNG